MVNFSRFYFFWWYDDDDELQPKPTKPRALQTCTKCLPQMPVRNPCTKPKHQTADTYHPIKHHEPMVGTHQMRGNYDVLIKSQQLHAELQHLISRSIVVAKPIWLTVVTKPRHFYYVLWQVVVRNGLPRHSIYHRLQYLELLNALCHAFLLLGSLSNLQMGFVHRCLESLEIPRAPTYYFANYVNDPKPTEGNLFPRESL